MSFFDSSFIKNLFSMNYPVCCSEWSDPNSNDTINDYGILLKRFVAITNDTAKQLKYAKKINDTTKTKYEDSKIEEMITTYNKLKTERKENIKKSQASSWFGYGALTSVPTLSNDNDEVWGSKRQYLYGKVCSDIMKQNNIELSPFMCSALNPTGGICGAGNQSLYKGEISSPMIVHSCIHDASGYCYNYHNMGLGYNYLSTRFALPTYLPMSCQMMGIYTCWNAKMIQ